MRTLGERLDKETQLHQVPARTIAVVDVRVHGIVAGTWSDARFKGNFFENAIRSVYLQGVIDGMQVADHVRAADAEAPDYQI
jgi:hypothetical protein